MSDTQINYKAVAFYIILFTALVLTSMYFLGNHIQELKPVTAFFNSAGKTVSGALGNFDVLGAITGTVEWIQQNTVVTGVLATLGTTAVTMAIKNWQTNKLLDQKLEELNNAKVDLSLTQKEVGKVSTKLTSAEEEIKMYTEDKTSEILQTRISEMQTGYERQLAEMRRQLEQKELELKQRPFVEVVKTR